MDGGADFKDPGWSGPLRRGATLVPFVGRLLDRRSDGDPESPLVLVRKILAAFAVALLGLLWVAVALASTERESTSPAVWSIAVTAAIGLASFVGVLLIRRRTLACGSDKELLGAYTDRFFAQMAAAQVPALAGIVATFLSVSLLPYLLGGGVAAAGFALAAPTRAEILRTQERLEAQGCARRLGLILTSENQPEA
ncbi:MAG: hypothetical protein AAGA90_01125 [Actinomycetota bacterium]